MSKWSEVIDWLERARHKLSPSDFMWLTPPGALAIILGFAFAKKPPGARAAAGAAPEDVVDLSQRDPELVELALDLFRSIGRHYFRLQIEGVHHVPASGPVMLVGNHNGAILPLDAMFTLVAVRDRLGPERIVHPLSHDGIFFHPTVTRYANGLGVVKASHAGSSAILGSGRVMLVYPGSDWEASRPFAERGRIDFAGRQGFLRVALRHRVPIVPVVSVGTHEQLVILSRGERIARALRLPELMRTRTFPIALALPWGLSSGLLPYVPLPAQTTVAFGAPLSFAELFPGVSAAAANTEAPEALARGYDIVTARMQAMLDELQAGRVPLLGKRKSAG
ncbi:MAG TPA: lysophospholipid acyltransferase family protein [Pseudomonadota bacterium]|nr:lysophospholipid acyltransferase family protein [Pseudomonadota bacterium]